MGLLVKGEEMFKYFIHKDSNGNVVGYDMAPDHLTVKDFNKNNPFLQTTEIDKEAFEEAVSAYKGRRKVG